VTTSVGAVISPRRVRAGGSLQATRAGRRGRFVGCEDRLEGAALHRDQALAELRRGWRGAAVLAVEPSPDVQLHGLVDPPSVEQGVLFLVEGFQRRRSLPAG
jgi:hypothetical protein